MIPETEIAKMKERAEKATPGPWESHELVGVPMVWDGSGDAIVNQLGADGRPYLEPDDALFVAHSRTDIPALLAERSELLSKIEEQEREGWVSVEEMPEDLYGERVLLCVIEEVEDCDGVTHRDHIISAGQVEGFPQGIIASLDYECNEYEAHEIVGYKPLPAPPVMEKQGVVDVPKEGE